MTELSGSVAFLTVEDHRQAAADQPALLASVGRPLPTARIKLVDSNDIFIEVVAGINEGEEVVLNPTALIEEAEDEARGTRPENDSQVDGQPASTANADAQDSGSPDTGSPNASDIDEANE